MQELVVACVQQRMRLPRSPDEYREDLVRFMRVAQDKNARLVVFAELAGTMVALPLLAGLPATLLKQADQGRRRDATLWQRLRGSLSAAAAHWLRVDLRSQIGGLLELQPQAVWNAYNQTFGQLAQQFNVTLVAPSAYLPDPADGQIRNIAAVFGPNGERLGYQAKVILHREDEGLAQPGSSWDVIQTEVGRLGLMLGGDVLFPEVGRLFAFQDAEILVAQGACANLALYHKLRAAMLARMQDNQLFGVISFLVGHNELSPPAAVQATQDGDEREPYVGKSAILAPQEMTPRYSGVLVEMGNLRSEGVLAATWDFTALRALWEASDTPVRRQLPQATQVIAQLYARLQSLPRQTPDPDLLLAEDADAFAEPEPAAAPQLEESVIHSLDELPVLSSVSARWPLADDLPHPVTRRHDKADAAPDPSNSAAETLPDAPPSPTDPADGNAAEPQGNTPTQPRKRVSDTDETEEMDAIP